MYRTTGLNGAVTATLDLNRHCTNVVMYDARQHPLLGTQNLPPSHCLLNSMYLRGPPWDKVEIRQF